MTNEKLMLKMGSKICNINLNSVNNHIIDFFTTRSFLFRKKKNINKINTTYPSRFYGEVIYLPKYNLNKGFFTTKFFLFTK